MARTDPLTRAGKAAVAAQRQQRLAHRNPARLQQQIDSLRESGNVRDQKQVQELEQELARVKKAREALGADRNHGPDRDSNAGRGRDGGGTRGGGVLGKRSRGDHAGRGDRGRGDLRGRGQSEESSGVETDESVRRIPMPKDTPPPPPRRERRNQQQQDEKRQEAPKVQPPQTVYESAPAVRDLQKEAVKGLVPAAVLRRREFTKGEGREVTKDKEGKKEDVVNAIPSPEEGAMDVDDELARFEAEVAGLRREEQKQALGLDYSDSDGSAEVKGKVGPGHVEMEEIEDEEA